MAIDATIKSQKTMNRLAMALGYDDAQNDDRGKKEAVKYASSVLAEVEKNKDIQRCSPESVVQCMIDAAQFKISIDGRQHAHIISYGSTASLQIGYRGYLKKLSEYYDNVDFTAEPIFDGDEFSVHDEDGFQKYHLKKSNPFMDDKDKLQGVFVCISYEKNGRKFQKISSMSKEEIEKIRSTAKSKNIWDKWYLEKAKVAAIKRACKIHFASIQGIQEMAQYDNTENHVLNNKGVSEVEVNDSDQLTKELMEKKGNETDDEYNGSETAYQGDLLEAQGDHQEG